MPNRQVAIDLPVLTCFVRRNPLLRRHLRDELADQLVRDVLDVAETDTALAHVQFRRDLGGVGLLEPAEQFRVAIDTHMIQGDVVLLGNDTQKRERAARRDVIAGRIRR